MAKTLPYRRFSIICECFHVHFNDRETVRYVIGSKIQCQTALNALVERSAAIPASLVAYRRWRLWRQRGVSSGVPSAESLARRL